MGPESITDSVEAGGAAIPKLGFGTARMSGDECRRAVETALEAGYRHVKYHGSGDPWRPCLPCSRGNGL